jgi:hypothetical protein
MEVRVYKPEKKYGEASWILSPGDVITRDLSAQ